MALLDNLSERDAIHKAVTEIHRLETEADDLAVEAIGGLYDGVTDIPSLVRSIRWGDLYEILEEATDKAAHVPTALQNIAIKHA